MVDDGVLLPETAKALKELRARAKLILMMKVKILGSGGWVKSYWVAVLIGALLAVMLFSSTQVASADPTELPTGGEGFDDAVELQLNDNYEGGSLANHEVEYFFITGIKPGQQVNIRGTFTTSTTYGACVVIDLYDEDRVKLHGIYEAPYGTDTYSFFWTCNSDEESYNYFIRTGSDYSSIYSRTLEIWIENYYDANSGTDAGNTFDTALGITVGDYQGFLAGTAGDDHEDFYVISLGSGQELDVTITPASDASYGLKIYDQTRTEKASTSSANAGAITSTSWIAPSAQDAYVRITRGYLTGSRTYSLNLSVEGGEAPENLLGTNMCLSMNAPASMDQGNTMAYTLYYNNFGSVSASNVVLQAALPSNVDFVSASDSGTYDSATRRVTWNIGSVPAFPSGRGSRTIRVRIPSSIPVGTVIQTTASISTSTLETRYDDNSATAQTTVTGLNLPPDVSVEPNNGGSTPSVYWRTPVTFSYHSSPEVTGVEIRIHIDDGGSDIIGSMTGGPPDWTYTTTFYPRTGAATVTYIVEPCQSQPIYNLPFLTDFELEDYDSMTTEQIREFLTSYNSYFRQPIEDVDGVLFDPPAVIAQAAIQYQINPEVILVTLQKESTGVTCTTRPPDTTMSFLMGCCAPSTAREQLICAAERFRTYQTQLINTGSTISGWQVGIPKTTEDGVIITPATRAVAGQFTYTPYAGVQWGGNQPDVGGVYLFYNFWNQFGFGVPMDDCENPTFNIYIDPAGYIYDTETGVRISGASVWLQHPDGTGGWENVPTGQTPPIMQPDINPLITSGDGQYQWDVLEGSYRVHVEAPGYYPEDSIVVSIPPPVTDLHVGLTPLPDNISTTTPAGEGVPWVWVCVGIAVVVTIAVVVLILIRKGKD